jgi:hypothetical protein
MMLGLRHAAPGESTHIYAFASVEHHSSRIPACLPGPRGQFQLTIKSLTLSQRIFLMSAATLPSIIESVDMPLTAPSEQG